MLVMLCLSQSTTMSLPTFLPYYRISPNSPPPSSIQTVIFCSFSAGALSFGAFHRTRPHTFSSSYALAHPAGTHTSTSRVHPPTCGTYTRACDPHASTSGTHTATCCGAYASAFISCTDASAVGAHHTPAFGAPHIATFFFSGGC